MKKGMWTVLGGIVGAIVSGSIVGKVSSDSTSKWKEMSDKHLALFLLMNQWVKVKQENKVLSTYFVERGYKNIAIYGMNYVGQTLNDEFKGTDVKVLYGIDRNAETIYADIELLTIEDDLPNVDVIVVTAITYYEEIKKELHKKKDCEIVSLEDILFEI